MKTSLRKSPKLAKSRIFVQYPARKWRKWTNVAVVLRNGNYIAIPSLEKNPDQKILFFHGEILILRFEVGIFKKFIDFC